MMTSQLTEITKKNILTIFRTKFKENSRSFRPILENLHCLKIIQSTSYLTYMQYEFYLIGSFQKS